MPSGDTPISGMVRISEWIESNPTLKYVRRHDEITPDDLPESSHYISARLILMLIMQR